MEIDYAPLHPPPLHSHPRAIRSTLFLCARPNLAEVLCPRPATTTDAPPLQPLLRRPLLACHSIPSLQVLPKRGRYLAWVRASMECRRTRSPLTCITRTCIKCLVDRILRTLELASTTKSKSRHNHDYRSFPHFSRCSHLIRTNTLPHPHTPFNNSIMGCHVVSPATGCKKCLNFVSLNTALSICTLSKIQEYPSD